MFFPQMSELQTTIEEIEKKVKEQSEYSQKINEWLSQGLAIKNEFKSLEYRQKKLIIGKIIFHIEWL